VKHIEGAYHAAGYSQVKVTAQVIKEGGDIKATFRVDEGVRDVVEALEVQGTSLSRRRNWRPTV